MWNPDEDPFETTMIELAKLEELVDAKAENERLRRILTRYVAEHGNRYERDKACQCIWCLESRDILT